MASDDGIFRAQQAEISLQATSLGLHPAGAELNPDFRAHIPLLRARLRVTWSPEHPGRAVALLRRRLMAYSPSLRRHHCGGSAGYRVAGHRRHEAAEPRRDLEAPLALAHLIEHVIIDVVSYVSGRRRVAGATGAHRGSRELFDIFVECADPRLAPLGLRLGIGWCLSLMDGIAPDGYGLPALELARLLYRRRPAAMAAGEAIRHLALEPEPGSQALGWLVRTGFAEIESCPASAPARPRYRLAGEDQLRQG